MQASTSLLCNYMAQCDVNQCEMDTVLSKTQELLRKMDSKVPPGALAKAKNCRHHLAIDLSCKILKIPYNTQALIALSKINMKDFQQAITNCKKLLHIETQESMAIDILAIRLGTELKAKALETLEMYRKSYVKNLDHARQMSIDLSSPEYQAAAYFVAAKSAKMAASSSSSSSSSSTSSVIDKKRIIEIVPNVNTRMFAKIADEMERHCLNPGDKESVYNDQKVTEQSMAKFNLTDKGSFSKSKVSLLSKRGQMYKKMHDPAGNGKIRSVNHTGNKVSSNINSSNSQAKNQGQNLSTTSEVKDDTTNMVNTANAINSVNKQNCSKEQTNISMKSVKPSGMVMNQLSTNSATKDIVKENTDPVLSGRGMVGGNKRSATTEEDKSEKRIGYEKWKLEFLKKRKKA